MCVFCVTILCISFRIHLSRMFSAIVCPGLFGVFRVATLLEVDWVEAYLGHRMWIVLWKRQIYRDTHRVLPRCCFYFFTVCHFLFNCLKTGPALLLAFSLGLHAYPQHPPAVRAPHIHLYLACNNKDKAYILILINFFAFPCESPFSFFFFFLFTLSVGFVCLFDHLAPAYRYSQNGGNIFIVWRYYSLRGETLCLFCLLQVRDCASAIRSMCNDTGDGASCVR